MGDLVKRLNELCDAAPFQASWYLKDFATGGSADRRGDVPVPSASTRKISIMMAALAAVHAGKLALDQKVTIDARYQANDSGTFQHLTPGFWITLRDTLLAERQGAAAVALAARHEGRSQARPGPPRLQRRRHHLQGRPPAVHPDGLHGECARGARRRHAGLCRRLSADRPHGPTLLRRSRERMREARMNVEAKLEKLGLELPSLEDLYRTHSSGAHYISHLPVQNLLYLSGTTPRKGGEPYLPGVVGKDLTLAQGYEAARYAVVTTLAAVKYALGDLDRVQQIVHLLGFVNSAPGFGDQPRVINGAADLLVELFGERGKPTRAAIGCQGLGGNASGEVLVTLLFSGADVRPPLARDRLRR